MPSLTEIIAGVGTAVGSAVAAWSIARHRSKKSAPGDSDPPSKPSKLDLLARDVRALTVASASISDRLKIVEAKLAEEARGSMPAILGDHIREDVTELKAQVRALERRLGEYLLVEEFRSYANMDTQRRDAIVEKLGKALGVVDVLAANMRRYER